MGFAGKGDTYTYSLIYEDGDEDPDVPERNMRKGGGRKGGKAQGKKASARGGGGAAREVAQEYRVGARVEARDWNAMQGRGQWKPATILGFDVDEVSRVCARVDTVKHNGRVSLCHLQPPPFLLLLLLLLGSRLLLPPLLSTPPILSSGRIPRPTARARRTEHSRWPACMRATRGRETRCCGRQKEES